MEFTRIQHKDSRQIISWFIDGKKVNKLHFDYQHQKNIDAGAQYNSSVTTRTKNGNFKHTYQL